MDDRDIEDTRTENEFDIFGDEDSEAAYERELEDADRRYDEAQDERVMELNDAE